MTDRGMTEWLLGRMVFGVNKEGTVDNVWTKLKMASRELAQENILAGKLTGVTMSEYMNAETTAKVRLRTTNNKHRMGVLIRLGLISTCLLIKGLQ